MHPFSITSNYNVLHYFPKNARNEHYCSSTCTFKLHLAYLFFILLYNLITFFNEFKKEFSKIKNGLIKTDLFFKCLHGFYCQS